MDAKSSNPLNKLPMYFKLQFLITATLYCIAACCLPGCTQNPVASFEKEFDQRGWLFSDSLVGNIAISDSKQSYQLLANCTVTENLPTHNLYLKVKVADMTTQNSLFSSNYSLVMFEPESGKPLGKSIEDATERSFVLLKGIRFEKPGDYQLVVKQYNRFDPMSGMKSIRLELVEED